MMSDDGSIVTKEKVEKYLLTTPINGIPSIKISIPDAGPADMES